MPDLYNPNNIPHGTAIITINSVAYKANDINITEPTKQLGREEVTGEDSDDMVLVAARRTGTATLQLATGSTAIPAAGMTFVYAFRASANRTWLITEVGTASTIAGIKTLSISFADVGAAA